MTRCDDAFDSAVDTAPPRHDERDDDAPSSPWLGVVPLSSAELDAWYRADGDGDGDGESVPSFKPRVSSDSSEDVDIYAVLAFGLFVCFPPAGPEVCSLLVLLPAEVSCGCPHPFVAVSRPTASPRFLKSNLWSKGPAEAQRSSGETKVLPS